MVCWRIQLADRTVLMIDETITFQTDILTKMRTSRHIFVCITRAMSLHFDYPLKGIYKVCRTKDWFSVIRAETLPLLNHKLYEMGVVVTESREGRSGHQMLTEIGVTHLIAAAVYFGKMHTKADGTHLCLLHWSVIMKKY